MINQSTTIEDRKYHWEIVFWRNHKKMGYLKISTRDFYLEFKSLWESGCSMADIITLATEKGIKV